MPISRMQQPRQQYGLGSFVKKAVKGVTGAVKKIAGSDLGKAALGLKSGKDALLGNVLKVGGYGTLLGGALAGMEGEEEAAAIGGERNVEALRTRLTKAYKELRYPEEQIPALVEADLAEYTSGAGAYAEGGRVNYAMGSPEENAIQASGIMGLTIKSKPCRGYRIRS
jgi:hypothetical protein